MSSDNKPVEVEGLGETHIITLYVRENGDNLEILHMTVDCEGEPVMGDVAAVFRHMADELDAGNFDNLGISQ